MLRSMEKCLSPQDHSLNKQVTRGVKKSLIGARNGSQWFQLPSLLPMSRVTGSSTPSSTFKIAFWAHFSARDSKRLIRTMPGIAREDDVQCSAPLIHRIQFHFSNSCSLPRYAMNTMPITSDYLLMCWFKDVKQLYMN